MKKKFLVIGNPIDHSLSPKLHNYWIKKYKIDAVYEKKLLNNNEIEGLILNIRDEYEGNSCRYWLCWFVECHVTSPA